MVYGALRGADSYQHRISSYHKGERLYRHLVWIKKGKEIDSGWDLAEEWEDALKDEDVLVECSERDRDPFGIVILQNSPQVGKLLSDG